jgi:hypothetical protein
MLAYIGYQKTTMEVRKQKRLSPHSMGAAAFIFNLYCIKQQSSRFFKA